MAGYPGPHTLPSVPSALYPPQATMLETHHAHTHPRHHVHTHSHAQHLPQPHGHDMALWGSVMEVGDRFYTLFTYSLSHTNTHAYIFALEESGMLSEKQSNVVAALSHIHR